MPKMHKMHYPIVTPEAFQFWGSRHKCNRLKAIIAFSQNIPDANYNLRRFGFQSHLRMRALRMYGAIVAHPDMTGVAFTPMSVPWWDCLSGTPIPPPHGRWAVWDDNTDWNDPDKWEEWIPDAPPAPIP